MDHLKKMPLKMGYFEASKYLKIFPESYSPFCGRKSRAKALSPKGWIHEGQQQSQSFPNCSRVIQHHTSFINICRKKKKKAHGQQMLQTRFKSSIKKKKAQIAALTMA